MNPARVTNRIFFESPKFAKNIPDRNKEIDNVFTYLFLLPNTPINRLPTSMPEAHID